MNYSQFQNVFEKTSKKDLNQFFAGWFHRPGFPEIDSEWANIVQRQKANHYQVKIKLSQVQKDDPFELPLKLKIILSNNQVIYRTIHFNQKQQVISLSIQTEAKHIDSENIDTMPVKASIKRLTPADFTHSTVEK